VEVAIALDSHVMGLTRRRTYGRINYNAAIISE